MRAWSAGVVCWKVRGDQTLVQGRRRPLLSGTGLFFSPTRRRWHPVWEGDDRHPYTVGNRVSPGYSLIRICASGAYKVPSSIRQFVARLTGSSGRPVRIRDVIVLRGALELSRSPPPSSKSTAVGSTLGIRRWQHPSWTIARGPQMTQDNTRDSVRDGGPHGRSSAVRARGRRLSWAIAQGPADDSR